MDSIANLTNAETEVSNCTQCEDESTSTGDFRLVAFMTLAILGIAANTIVCYILLLRENIRKESFMLFAACICFSDIVSSFVVLTLIVMRSIGVNYNKTFCFSVYSLSVTAFGSSTVYGLLISLERLGAVSCKGIKKIFHRKRKLVAALLPPCVIMVVTMTTINMYPTTGNYYYCEVGVMFSREEGLIPVVLTAQIFVTLPVFIIAILYTATNIRLKQHIAQIHILDSKRNDELRRNDSSICKTCQIQTFIPERPSHSTNLSIKQTVKKNNFMDTAQHKESEVSQSSTVTYMDQRVDIDRLKKKKGTKIYPFDDSNTSEMSDLTRIGNVQKNKPTDQAHPSTINNKLNLHKPPNFLKHFKKDIKKKIMIGSPTLKNIFFTPTSTSNHYSESTSENISAFNTRNQKLQKAVKTMIIIQILIVFAFVPNAIVEILKLFIFVPSFVQSITRLLAVMHPIFNPTVYILRIPRLRSELICRTDLTH